MTSIVLDIGESEYSFSYIQAGIRLYYHLFLTFILFFL